MIDKSADPKAKLIKAGNWLHTAAIKLKDKNGRGGVFLNCEKAFGFRPAWVSVTKVRGQHDSFVISVEKTPEILATEEKFAEDMRQKAALEQKAKESLIKKTEESIDGDGTAN